MNQRRTILVTGATGHLGGELVHRFTRGGHDAIALVHDRTEIIANNGRRVRGVPVLRGDVRSASLGLDRASFSELAERVGLIVHCAAVTEFGLPENRYTEVNVDGTANMLGVARRWDTDVVYVSTAYVCGEFNGTFREDQLDVGQKFANHYESSKFQAEHLVRGSGLRWSIVRPGIMTGDYRTGHTREYRHIYPILKVIADGKLRTLPGNYAATLAFSPVDHVVDAVVGAAERFEDNVGYTFHAVGASAASLRLLSDLLAEYPCLRMADLVTPATFSPDDLDDIERRYFDTIGTLYTSYLQRQLEFDSTNTRNRLEVASPPIGPAYLRRLLDSCLRDGYLGVPGPTVADVLADLQLIRSSR